MLQRALLRRHASTHAVVFDVDGVLVRGKHVIPPAPRVLRALQSEGVPFVFMTNGGGTSEARKAIALSKQFGVEVSGGLTQHRLQHWQEG
jgi:ribonucleotide monophosphatase NagD (HAD superfamily)